ncbi:hypothetical protein K432DRAFT_396045 [Lepidopterella palustris CBS 459.81]|uniref:F-box domain-containing protein n=1 Tax=Lepidopterella palustris CBS 459.81 TaxID=1314670 RepID=A0A8E2E457_9PEZI|nr:hypothetical protein K432DRAFT_396045 [Lepidopterella palustris CBS 459.81]
MASACDRVFRIIELLEHILIHLPPLDLLLSQRVCFQWHQLIKASASLQHALFLSPEPNHPCKATVPFPSTKEYPRRGLVLFEIESSSDPRRHLNPLLANHSDYEFAVHEFKNSQRFVGNILIFFTTRFHDTMRLSRPDASWRRMFLTLPPPSKIHIIFNYSIGGLPKDETRTVENERGVSMGELADAVWAGLKRATSPGPRANIWDLLDFLDWYPAEERAGLTVRLR